jgi:hypothetical protein
MTFFPELAAANGAASPTRAYVAQSFVSALVSMRVLSGHYKATRAQAGGSWQLEVAALQGPPAATNRKER